MDLKSISAKYANARYGGSKQIEIDLEDVDIDEIVDACIKEEIAVVIDKIDIVDFISHHGEDEIFKHMFEFLWYSTVTQNK